MAPPPAKTAVFKARCISPSAIFNPTDADYIAVCTAITTGKLKYVTFNHEVDVNGTPHLQISVIAPTQLRTSAWQTVLGGRVSNIVATKSPQDCVDCCQGFTVGSERQERKPGSQLVTSTNPGFEEYGTHTTAGARTDHHKSVDNIKGGTCIHNLVETMSGTVAVLPTEFCAPNSTAVRPSDGGGEGVRAPINPVAAPRHATSGLPALLSSSPSPLYVCISFDHAHIYMNTMI